MHESYRFTVRGRVQGVFFRQSAKQQADALGLGGWVRNRDDGAVEGVVHGADAAAIASFRDWLSRGPDRARVQEVRWSASDDVVSAGFEVKR